MLANFTLGQIVLAVFGVGFLIAFHELGHYAVARLCGMRVRSYSIGLGPQLWKLGFVKNGIRYQIGKIPFGGAVEIAGMSSFDEAAKDDPRAYLNRPRWQRWLVLFAGPAFNYIAAVFFFFLYFAGWPSPTDQTVVEMVRVHEGPAKAAGIKDGEFVVGTDAEFRGAIVGSEGKPVTFTVLNVEHGVVSREVTVVPVVVDGGYRLGVEPAARHPSTGVLMGVGGACLNALNESAQLLFALKALVFREGGVEVGGPLAIVAGMKDSIERGAQHFVKFLASASVSLGLFNLLPVPALDGIKMLFLTVEGIFRRNIKPRWQDTVNGVGLLAILAMVGLLTIKDGVRIFTKKSAEATTTTPTTEPAPSAEQAAQP